MIASALRDALSSGYTLSSLRADCLSGLTVGVIALPLAMALAIASGVPPQHGLYTTIVGGALIALTGGSRFNVSGPTAAFVVILLPIVQAFGLGGLLLATVLSGLVLIALGLARLGRLIEMVPYPVIIGFTSGIGVSIATLQIKDLLGLSVGPLEGHFVDKVGSLWVALPTLRWEDLSVGLATLVVMITWPRLKTVVPSHLVALLVGTGVALLGGSFFGDFQVATIGSRFSYQLGELQGAGIPPLPPTFQWPWAYPDASGEPIGLSFGLLNALIGPALAIAMLGAIESLLCAVVADGMGGSRHEPNGELIGQGIGNLLVPFFGGIPATAAIARTAANIRAGACSPLSALIHALTVLLAVVVLGRWLAYIPMAALAALLIMVAWNMSEARHFVRVVRQAPGGDVAVLLTCFSLTVLVDMVVAVAVGLGLAGVLFIRRVIQLTESTLLEPDQHEFARDLPATVAVYHIDGPLFFGAAQKAIRVLGSVQRQVRVVILDLGNVPLMDMTAIVNLESIAEGQARRGRVLILSRVAPRMVQKLARAGMVEKPGVLEFADDIQLARERAMALVSDA